MTGVLSIFACSKNLPDASRRDENILLSKDYCKMLNKNWMRYTVSALICAVLVSALCVMTQAAVKKQLPKKTVPKIVKPKVILPKPKTPSEIKHVEVKPVELPGQLVLSSSAESGAKLYNSWPLIVSVDLWRRAAVPDDKGNLPTLEPVTVKAKEGSWREALVVEIKNRSGAVVKLPMHPMKQADSSLTLGVDDSASAVWWMEPTETQELPSGAYTITVTFDSKLVDGLPEKVDIDAFQLSVMKEPSPLDQDMQSEKQLQLAMLASLKGDPKTANDIVDKLLAGDVANIGGHRLKSRLLLIEGKPREAVRSMDLALKSYFKKYPDACPPAGLFRERADILKDMKLETAEDTSEIPTE